MDQLLDIRLETDQTCESFVAFVDHIVEEILHCKTFTEVRFHLARISGARHLACQNDLSVDQAECIRASFKKLAAHSSILAWAMNKPYGYAGDFVALEMLYDNIESPSSSPLGKLLDRWLLDAQLGIGVRERKDLLSQFIQQKANAVADATRQPLRLLSLASGSARELRELSEATLAKIDISLVDIDQRSLNFAAAHLPEDVTGYKRNALRLKPQQFPHSFDLIYSFGFFDYLADPLIVHCLKFCSAALAPCGSIVFPLKIDSKFRHWFYDVFLDWRFVPREIEAGFRLAQEAGLEVVELIETENESVVFFHCINRFN